MTGGAQRVDVALVARGLLRSRTLAAHAVRVGRVRADGVVVTRPSHPVDEATVLDVRGGDLDVYVSRAGHKLAGALAAIDVLDDAALPCPRPVVAGARCLDVGASTGGFTQVLLEQGAHSVVALDVGHGQLDPTLRADPRVRVREGANARELRADDLPEPVQVVVADLSFISLNLVIPAVRVAAPDADLLLMVKPQFEVGRERLGRGGVVRDAELHVAAVLDVVGCASAHGAGVVAVAASSLPGPSGNREFFCWFSPRRANTDTSGVERAVRAAVADSEGRVAHLVGDAPSTQGGEL